MDRPTRILVGTVLIVVIISIVSLITILRNSPWCEFGNINPIISISRLRNIASGDYKALVKFAGYLRRTTKTTNNSFTDSKLFMPLEIKTVNLNQIGAKHLLTLSTNCSKIALTLNMAGADRTLLVVESIQIALVKPIESASDNSKCFITSTRIFSGQGKHYRCLKDDLYPCRASSNITDKNYDKEMAVASSDNKINQISNRNHTTVAQLIIQVFEFEFMGDPFDFIVGNFSTPAEDCQ